MTTRSTQIICRISDCDCFSMLANFAFLANGKHVKEMTVWTGRRKVEISGRRVTIALHRNLMLEISCPSFWSAVCRSSCLLAKRNAFVLAAELQTFRKRQLLLSGKRHCIEQGLVACGVRRNRCTGEKREIHFTFFYLIQH